MTPKTGAGRRGRLTPTPIFLASTQLRSGKWFVLTWTADDGSVRWSEGQWCGPEHGWRDRCYQALDPDGFLDMDVMLSGKAGKTKASA